MDWILRRVVSENSSPCRLHSRTVKPLKVPSCLRRTDHHPTTIYHRKTPSSSTYQNQPYPTTSPPNQPTQPHLHHVPLQPAHFHAQHTHHQQNRHNSSPSHHPPNLQRRVQQVRLDSREWQQVQALWCEEVSFSLPPISLLFSTKQENRLLTKQTARSR
jgi:hypothetical protein